MNKIKMLLLVMVVALLFAACNKPDENPTDPSGDTNATEQVTEATEPETNLPGVEENQFSEDEIVIPTDPVAETTGNDSESGVTNTGNGNSGNGNSGSQGNSGNGSSGSQGNSGNGNSGSQGNSGNGSSGSQGNSGNQGSTGTTEPSGEIVYVTYEEYNNMSADEQVAYFNQFPSMEAFVEWYNEAKAEHDKENGAIEIGGDGGVDLGEIVNP